MINNSMTGVAQARHAHRHSDNQSGQSFTALGKALQSGDLAGAQKAFQSLQQNAPKNATAQSGTVGTALSALGSALQSGDLTSAQTAFATLQKDVQAKRGHHGGSPAPATVPDSDGDNDGSSTGAVNISA